MSGFNFAEAYEQNADALAGDVLPEGDYIVVVKSAKSVQTTAGKAAIRLQLEVAEGPYAGRTLPDQLTWSPESEVAMKIFSQSLAILGASTEWVRTTMATGEMIADRVTGAKASVAVKISEWNGQDRNNVNYKKSLGNMMAPEAPVSLAGGAAASAATSPAWPA